MKTGKETALWLGKILAGAVFINILIEWFSRKSIADVAGYVLESPLVFLLNTLILAFPFMGLFFTKRKYFVYAMAALVWLAAGITNGILLIFRTTPFTAADFRLVKYALNMLTTYMTWTEIIASAVGCVLAALLCCVTWKKAPKSEQPVSYLSGTILAAASLALILGSTALEMKSGLIAEQFGNIGQAYKDYGFAYCFTNSLFNTGIEKPKTYDSETVAMIEDGLFQETVYELEEHKTPNIIMIQLESFFDPTMYRNYRFETDPIPFFRYLKNHYPSGYLNVPSVGAGTANTEFECITGMNLDFFGPGEYPYKTILQKTTCESIAFHLKELGYVTHAIHNNEATFYDRNRVFSQLGFDTFTPIEYMYDIKRNEIGWCEDDILVDEIVKTLDSTEVQDFIYTITVQSHGAYPSFEYYCQQLHEVDNMIKRLIYTLSRREEPTVVVMYGDHLPGFAWEPGDMKNNSLFQTPYVIWNNMNLTALRKNMESYQISAYLLELLNIHEGTMTKFHQNYMKNPGDRQQYLEEMEVLQYDILYGEQEIYGGENPYEATNLQMGVVPIQIEQVVYSEPNLLVYGENFNTYSKVCINGKDMDTQYIWPQLLLVRDVPEKKALDPETEITVKQIGRDKVPLGEARNLRN